MQIIVQIAEHSNMYQIYLIFSYGQVDDQVSNIFNGFFLLTTHSSKEEEKPDPDRCTVYPEFRSRGSASVSNIN